VNVSLLSPAEIEIASAVEWYDEQEAGLGPDFLDEIEHTIESIAALPTLYPQVLANFRRALVRRYPYCIWYEITTTEVVIHAVSHLRRHPDYWQDRR
jgi:plasmid stabilization system protein ParE